MSWWTRLCAAVCCLSLVSDVVALAMRLPGWSWAGAGICASALGMTAFVLRHRMGGEQR